MVRWSLQQLSTAVARLIRARPANVARYLRAPKMNDVKPLLGALLEEELREYSHWGWMDLDVILGDLQPLPALLRSYHVVTFPDGAFGAFYLCGQLTVTDALGAQRRVLQLCYFLARVFLGSNKHKLF